MRAPIRYFVVNENTKVMHIFGFCPQTKVRKIPIRLFDIPEQLYQHVGRPLRLCAVCAREQEEMK